MLWCRQFTTTFVRILYRCLLAGVLVGVFLICCTVGVLWFFVCKDETFVSINHLYGQDDAPQTQQNPIFNRTFV